ncbi:hypothetical protein DFS34DRAFT_603234 [Phlyctochytrium arcticum]|nr:hypothetical protein DFS34DRAFT_603234 [Phlyctochytrium arcticum]
MPRPEDRSRKSRHRSPSRKPPPSRKRYPGGDRRIPTSDDGPNSSSSSSERSSSSSSSSESSTEVSPSLRESNYASSPHTASHLSSYGAITSHGGAQRHGRASPACTTSARSNRTSSPHRRPVTSTTPLLHSHAGQSNQHVHAYDLPFTSQMVGHSVMTYSAPIRQSARLPAIDCLRGIAVLFMLIVNYQFPGHSWPTFTSTSWIGLTLVDLVFPTFLFVTGVSIPVAFHIRPRQTHEILMKGCKWIMLGLALNVFLSMPGIWVSNPEWESFRWAGFLQRIGIVYIACALVYALCSWLIFLILFPVCCFLFWTIISYEYPVPSFCNPLDRMSLQPPECTSQSVLDLKLLGGPSHLFEGQVYDPEGVLSTLTACLTGWLGVLCGVSLLRLLHRPDGQWRLRTAGRVALTGIACLLLGFILGRYWIPISKALWTPSFVLVTGGSAMLLLAASLVMVDMTEGKQLSPLVALGRSSLLLYIGSELIRSLLSAIPAPNASATDTMYVYLFERLVASWVPDGWNSLLWALGWTGGIYVPLALYLDQINCNWRP